MPKSSSKLLWRVHTPSLLTQVLDNEGAQILAVPINIFGKLLAAVADRAAVLNDPELNKLMVRLTLYSQADPHSPDYDAALVKSTMAH
jgi:hypothetical protein